MAFPYSDNMYSMDDSDDEQPMVEGSALAHRQTDIQSHEGDRDSVYNDALSPTDGYFRGSGSSTSASEGAGAVGSFGYEDPYSSSQPRDSRLHSNPSASYATAASSNVSHVPDVWVSDPSLEQGSTAESKAREVREEREQNRRQLGSDNFNRYPSSAASTAANYYSPSATAASERGNNNNCSAVPYIRQPARSAEHTRSSSLVVSSSGYPPSSQHHQYTSSFSSYASPSNRGGPIYSERSSLFTTPNEAPPAYTPSPTSPTRISSSSDHLPASRNYRTFHKSMMGRPEESQGLLAGQEPESMGEPDDELVHRAWRERMHRRLPYFNWRSCRLFGLGLALLLITVGFLVSSFVSVKDQKDKLKSPSTFPDTKMPVQDGVKLSYPPFDGDMPWEQEQHCLPKQIKYPLQTFNIDFAQDKNLSFSQDVQRDSPDAGSDVRISGDVVVRRAGSGTPDASLILEVVTNDDNIKLDIQWDPDTQGMFLLTPLKIPWSNTGNLPCLYIRATIWVAADSILETLNVETVHLGIQLLDNLSLHMTRFVRLTSTVGTIVGGTDGERDLNELMHQGAPSTFTFDSRYIEIKTTSNSIQGSWPLYDYLGLESTAGSIHAGVEPKAALPDKPRPAILYVHTISGSVEVYEPIQKALQTFRGQEHATDGVGALIAEDVMPPRNYGVDLYTMSGTIKGSLAFGYQCKVHTTSGSVELTLLPVLDKSLAAASASAAKKYIDLESTTTSGTTQINILEPIWSDMDKQSYVRFPQAPSAPVAPLAPAVPVAPTPPTVPIPPVEFMPVGDSDPYDYLGSLPPAEAEAEADAASDITPSQQPTEQQQLMSAALRVLRSRHASTSASIRVYYPSAWEGDIEADSLTGTISIGGQGVEIIKRTEDFPGYHSTILARKGPEGGGKLVLHTTSGTITAQVGQI